MEFLDQVPQQHRERFAEIVELTDHFCEQHLNEEYRDKCRQLAVAAAQEEMALERGKPQSWASGIVHAIGMINFLSDPSFEPDLRSPEIAEGFGVSTGTMQAKSRALRESLDLFQADPQFTVPNLLEQNPLAWLIEVDGVLIDARHAPRDIQEEVYRQGLIPYIPGEPEAETAEGPDRDRVRSRYQHLRQVGVDLNHKLTRRLSTEIIQEGGKKLGTLKDDQLMLGTEDEIAVLMDYCIYNVRRKGRTAFEEYLEESPPDADSDEMRCLRAMQNSVYSIFAIKSVVRELGVVVRNLLSGNQFLVADLGFSRTAEPGLVLVSRMLFFGDFAMTGGAALSLGRLTKDKQKDWAEYLSDLDDPTEEGFSDPAPVIQECLEQGGSERLQYV